MILRKFILNHLCPDIIWLMMSNWKTSSNSKEARLVASCWIRIWVPTTHLTKTESISMSKKDPGHHLLVKPMIMRNTAAREHQHPFFRMQATSSRLTPPMRRMKSKSCSFKKVLMHLRASAISSSRKSSNQIENQRNNAKWN